MSPPTKKEIRAKYKDKILANDFELLIDTPCPSPNELQAEGAFMEFWGHVKGFGVWAKRKLGGPIILLILLHDCFETYRDFSPYAIQGYSTVAQYIERFEKHHDEPATEYIVFTPEHKDPVSPFAPSQDDLILPGTGIYPISEKWKLI